MTSLPCCTVPSGSTLSTLTVTMQWDLLLTAFMQVAGQQGGAGGQQGAAGLRLRSHRVWCAAGAAGAAQQARSSRHHRLSGISEHHQPAFIQQPFGSSGAGGPGVVGWVWVWLTDHAAK